MARQYRVHEFADLAGVTVKALQHYDRLGLLTPARTNAGHRRYTVQHLERLEQILALKLIGLPLKDIKDALDRDARSLSEILRAQRRMLEGKRMRLDRVIAAIQEVERGVEGQRSQVELLRQVIGAIAMQDDIDVMRQYFSEAAWPKAKQHYESGPSSAWLALLHETEAVLDDDPAGERAQALVVRWRDLWQAETGGDPGIREGMMKAWMDRDRWPASVRRRMEALHLERVMRFLADAAWELAARQSERSSARLTVPHRVSESRIAFFRDVEAALADGPSPERGRALARRWDALTAAETGNDPDTKAQMMRAMTSYRHWPTRMREYVAGLYVMTPDRWEKVVDFIADASRAFGEDRA